MDETKRDALKRMLDGFEHKQQKEIQQRDDHRIALERFLADYGQVTLSVIRPAFEEFSAALGGRDHPCTIDLGESAASHDNTDTAEITLTIFPNSATLPHGNPSLSYRASSNQRKITSHRRAITPGGKIAAISSGEYTLQQLTREVVEQHLLELAESTFGQ